MAWCLMVPSHNLNNADFISMTEPRTYSNSIQFKFKIQIKKFTGLVQDCINSNAWAMKLCLSCINPSIYEWNLMDMQKLLLKRHCWICILKWITFHPGINRLTQYCLQLTKLYKYFWQSLFMAYIKKFLPQVFKDDNHNWNELDSTRRKASDICLRPPLHIYFHKFSR